MITALPTLRGAARGFLMTRGMRSRRVKRWLHLDVVKQDFGVLGEVELEWLKELT